MTEIDALDYTWYKSFAIFTARCYASAVLCCHLSVCLPVCPCVTILSSTKAAKPQEFTSCPDALVLSWRRTNWKFVRNLKANQSTCFGTYSQSTA